MPVAPTNSHFWLRHWFPRRAIRTHSVSLQVLVVMLWSLSAKLLSTHTQRLS